MVEVVSGHDDGGRWQDMGAYTDGNAGTADVPGSGRGTISKSKAATGSALSHPFCHSLYRPPAGERLASRSFSSPLVEHAIRAFALPRRPAFPCLLYPCLDVPRPRSVPGGRPPSFWQAVRACRKGEHHPPRTQCTELRIQHQHYPRRQRDTRPSRYRKVCDA